MSATYPHAGGRANVFAGHGVWLLMIIRNVTARPSTEEKIDYGARRPGLTGQ
jgi:hypothetical protein